MSVVCILGLYHDFYQFDIYMYILSKKHWYIKQTTSLAIKSVVSCYIKSLQVLFTRLVKSTNLMRILSNDSDDRIDLSSLDQMTGPK